MPTIDERHEDPEYRRALRRRIARGSNTVWLTAPYGGYPQMQVTHPGKDEIVVNKWSGVHWLDAQLSLTRHEAMMLARRLNQCLEDTK